MDRMRPQAEARHIELGLQTAPEIPPLALDKESVSDAVRNLLDNAIKYSPDCARVDVSLGLADGRVELTVGDKGIGVDPADAQRIFEPFFRSRRGDHANVHGTGLGLPLVKATVEAHGGTVRWRATASAAARSRWRFQSVGAGAPDRADPPHRDQPRVLIADDEPAIVMAIQDELQFEGFAVEAAGTGPEAVTLARASKPDVLLLDLMLPGQTDSRCAARSGRSGRISGSSCSRSAATSRIASRASNRAPTTT